MAYFNFLFYFYCLHNYWGPHFPLLCPLLLCPHSQPLPPSSLWPSPHCCLCLGVIHTSALAHAFTFFHPVPTYPFPSDSCQSVPWIDASVSMWLISLFCLLDFTFKWDHTVFAFHCLAYFTQHNTLQFPPFCWKR